MERMDTARQASMSAVAFWRLKPKEHHGVVLGSDSLSILFNHRSFQRSDLFPTWVFHGFLKRRIPGKNGEGTPRVICPTFPSDCITPKDANQGKPIRPA